MAPTPENPLNGKPSLTPNHIAKRLTKSTTYDYGLLDNLLTDKMRPDSLAYKLDEIMYLIVRKQGQASEVNRQMPEYFYALRELRNTFYDMHERRCQSVG